MASLTENNLRVDKWLWAVRIFKTRSIAAEACKKGRVLIDDKSVKPSRILKIGDIVKVRKLPVVYSFRVKGLLGKRQSAQIVLDFVEDVTPAEEKMKLENNLTVFVQRDRGEGRPTKKERRDIDKLTFNEEIEEEL